MQTQTIHLPPTSTCKEVTTLVSNPPLTDSTPPTSSSSSSSFEEDGNTPLDDPLIALDHSVEQHSIPYVVFGHHIVDRSICQASDCQHTSEWELVSNLVFNIYASEIVASPATSMEAMLRHLVDKTNGEDIHGPRRKCGKCEHPKPMLERQIHRFPKVKEKPSKGPCRLMRMSVALFSIFSFILLIILILILLILIHSLSLGLCRVCRLGHRHRLQV